MRNGTEITRSDYYDTLVNLLDWLCSYGFALSHDAPHEDYITVIKETLWDLFVKHYDSKSKRKLTDFGEMKLLLREKKIKFDELESVVKVGVNRFFLITNTTNQDFGCRWCHAKDNSAIFVTSIHVVSLSPEQILAMMKAFNSFENEIQSSVALFRQDALVHEINSITIEARQDDPERT